MPRTTTSKGKCRCCGATSDCGCFDECFPWEDVACDCPKCSCNCSPCFCNNRAGGYFGEYEIAVSGLTGDPFIEPPPFSALVSLCAPTCSVLNGTFRLKYRANCLWTTDETLTTGVGGGCFARPDGSSVAAPLWSMTMPYCGRGCLTHPTHFDPGIGTSRHNTWGLNSATFPAEPDTAAEGLCRTSQGLPAGANEQCIIAAGFHHFCNVRPDPITVTPVGGTWVSCGLPEPGGGGMMAAAPPPPPSGGPGTELKALLESLGVRADAAGCGCEGYARQMDRWGVEGCKARRAEIVGRLREQARGQALQAWAEAGVRAIASGLALRLNPLDPLPGLVDEAIRRAKAKGGQ